MQNNVFVNVLERERYMEITAALNKHCGLAADLNRVQQVTKLAIPVKSICLFQKLTSSWNSHAGNKLMDVLGIMCKHGLTLRSLVIACEACSKNPSATMLASALTNSIPGLKNLNMERADPVFYTNIAKQYYSDLTIKHEVQVYAEINEGDNEFGITRYLDLQAPRVACNAERDQTRFPNMMAEYADRLLRSLFPVTGIKKGRELIKKVLLGWREQYEGDARLIGYIDHVVWQVDNVHVLQFHMMDDSDDIPLKEICSIGFNSQPNRIEFNAHMQPIFRPKM